MIIVKHGPDCLLQKSVEAGIPGNTRGTFVEEVTKPVHRALLKFLDAGVVGTHESESALREILESWPGYAKARGIDINGAARDFQRLWITRERTIAAAFGPGGNFEIALIEKA